MANRYGDPKVKEFMKTHPDEVAKVQKRYGELKVLTTEELVRRAPEDVVAKVRSMLIVGIVAKEG